MRKDPHAGRSKVVRLALPTVAAAHRFAGDGLSDTVACTTAINANEGGDLERLRDAVNARQTAHGILVALSVAETCGATATPVYMTHDAVFAVRIEGAGIDGADVRCGGGIRRLVEAQLRKWGIHLEQLTGELEPEPLPTIEEVEATSEERERRP